MEAATLSQETQTEVEAEGHAEVATPVADKPDALKTVGQLFRFSAWIHLGEDAEKCEGGEDGTCTSSAHFHAWIRLPNQFQNADIREKATAAKARRMRLLKDQASDAYEILEADLDQLRGDGSREALVNELVARDYWNDQTQAIREINEREEFETISADQEHYNELQSMDEEKRPVDEYEELERHLDAYNNAVDERRKKLETPRREALEAREDAELIDMVREDRITSEGNREFMRTWNLWSWFVGTYNAPKGTRLFKTKEDLEEAPPEIVQAIAVAFADLESSLQRGLVGNS